MIVVGLDCSGDDLLFGLADDERVMDSWRVTARRRHSELLPGEILSRLEAVDVTLPEVSGFAIISGPGSYTGLRVAAATVLGLASAGNVPTAVLSSFEFLRRLYAVENRRLGCLIPCRGEYYYWCTVLPTEDSDGGVEVLTAVEIAQSIDEPMRIVGPKTSEMEKALSPSDIDVEVICGPPPEAGGLLALWGKEKIEAGNIIDWGNWQLDYGPAPAFRKWSRPTTK